jgi:dihydropyrimidinase
MTILLTNGTLVTAAETFTADILIEGEKIAAIGRDLVPPPAAEIQDIRGMLVMPGGVDPHTHFNLPMFDTVSSDDHYTGHKAAAFGGTTTVIDFVPHDPGSLADNIAAWHARADRRAAIDFSFHMNIQRMDEAIAAEIPTLPALGITTLKVFMAYNGRLRLDDAGIFRVLRLAQAHGMLTMLHAENGDAIEQLTAQALAAGKTRPEWHARTRPPWSAVEAVLRGAALAAQAGAPLYIVHMNTAGEVDMLEYARRHGAPVMGETCPQYLFFTEAHLRREDGAKWICSPPMRQAEDNLRLWQGLSSGILQVVGTDHCPFFFDGTQPIIYEGQPVAIPGKELGRDDFTKIPNGLPGVQDRLPILWTYGVRAGRISANQFVALTSTNPAKIFGLYPRKGALLPGSDADLAVWDPDKAVTYGVKLAHHRTDYNLYEGWELVGYPVQVYLRGRRIIEGDRWLGAAGEGQFIQRAPGAPRL